MAFKKGTKLYRWTSKEDEIIKTNYEKFGPNVCQLLPRRTWEAIQARAFKLNIKRERFWTEDECKILTDNYKTLKGKIAILLPNRTIRNIRNKAKELNLATERLDKHFIWNNDYAYYLGLVYSDGSLSEKNHSITIELKSDETEEKLLLELKNKIGFGNIYHRTREITRWEKDIIFSTTMYVISNISFYNDLVKLGLSTKKSLNILFPEIPDKYLSDFVRGYFDGDGSISYTRSYLSSFTSGSKIFLEKLLEILKAVINVKNGHIYSKKDTNSHSLSFSHHDSILLREYIYQNPNCLKLDRKFQKFYTRENSQIKIK